MTNERSTQIKDDFLLKVLDKRQGASKLIYDLFNNKINCIDRSNIRDYKYDIIIS
jgi:hypothetical protein